MNCRTCQHELSEYLDGRLASGRRTQVLDHLAACDECTRAFAELQRAQAAVQRLTRHHTGADFRARLFARIEAGEGTPPAVFREPIPLLAKVRYTLTGAAAAAALVVVASLLRDRNAVETLPSGTSAPAVVASNATPKAPATVTTAAHPAVLAGANQEPDYVASAEASPLAPRSSDSFLGAVKPLTPDLLAVETARQFEQRHQWTSRRLSLLGRGAFDDTMAARIRDDAQSLARLGGVLTELREARCLTFADPEVDTDLRVFMTLIDSERLGRAEPLAQVVRDVVEPAMRKSPNLGRIASAIAVTPATNRMTQDEQVLRITRAWPELIDQIFFVLPDGAENGQFDPLQLSRTFRFRSECGTIFVAPMSEVEGPQTVFRSLQIRVESAPRDR